MQLLTSYPRTQINTSPAVSAGDAPSPASIGSGQRIPSSGERPHRISYCKCCSKCCQCLLTFSSFLEDKELNRILSSNPKHTHSPPTLSKSPWQVPEYPDGPMGICGSCCVWYRTQSTGTEKWKLVCLTEGSFSKSCSAEIMQYPAQISVFLSKIKQIFSAWK